MAQADSERELTSTLHLGLRSVVEGEGSDLINDYLQKASSEERAVIESALNGAPDKAMIVIHRGAQKGARFLITVEGASIGRAAESSIFLDDVTVSRKHATITKSDSGFSFSDLGSLNGSYINNQPTTSRELRSGDEIQIGKYHLLFICNSQQGEK